jgi:hypothetical protein
MSMQHAAKTVHLVDRDPGFAPGSVARIPTTRAISRGCIGVVETVHRVGADRLPGNGAVCVASRLSRAE